MAKYIMREMPDMGDTGRRKAYPKLAVQGMIDYEALVERVHDMAGTFSCGTVKGVVSALLDTMQVFMADGHSVKIDGLGTFTPSLRMKEGEDDEMHGDDDSMSYRHVSVRGINFKADAPMVRKLRDNMSLERKKHGVSGLRQSRYTLDERVEMAMRVIDSRGFITLMDYAALGGLSRAAASRELKMICEAPGFPIMASGMASHKIWVRRR